MPIALDQPRSDPNARALGSDADASAMDIAVEDAASEIGLPFLPEPPPTALGMPTLVGVAILDRDLRYRRIDPALAAAYGATPEEHVGRTLEEIAPRWAPAFGPAQRQVLETGEPLLSAPIDGAPIDGAGRGVPAGRSWLGNFYPLPPSPGSLGRGRTGPAGVIAVVREVDAELALRPRGVSDERFRELVTRATVGLAQVDLEGRFLYVNDRFCEITGWNRGQLVGVRTQQQITHSRDAGRNRAKFRAAAAGGEPYLIDKRYRRPDGRSVWVRNTVTVLPGADGRPESIFAVSVDMTDRVRTERALIRSERRMRLAAEAGRLGVWSFDLKNGVPDWSPEALAMYGGGFGGKPGMEQLRERVHPDDRDMLDDTAGEPNADGALRVDLTHRVVHPPRPGPDGAEGPGEVRWVRALGERWVDGGGRPLRSVGVLRDVTDERAAADKLAASERRLRLAIDAADLGIWEFDAATGLSDWDERTAELFGVGDRFRAGRRLFTHDEMFAAIHPGDRARIREEIPKTLDPAGAGKYDVEHRVVHPDGAVRLLAVAGEATFAGAGGQRRAVRVTGTVKDVTERRERDLRLAASEGRLRLAAGAAELGLYELDLQTGNLWWDDRCREIFDFPAGGGGAGRDALDGTPIPLAEGMGRIHPEDAPGVAADLAALRAEAEGGEGPVRFHINYRIVRRDGSHAHVRSDGEVRAGPAAGDRPGALRLIGCLRDVTAEVSRERRLAEAADRLNLAAEAAELGAYDVDLKAGTVWWDDRVRALYDVPDAPETVSLEEAFARVHPDDRPAVEGAMAAAHAPGGPTRFRYEYRVRRSGRPDRWIRAHGVAEFEGTGARRAAVRQTGYVQDVTAERDADAALKDAKRRLEGANFELAHANERLEREVAKRTAQLRTAAERLAEVARQERDRIAHVLHDHLQQILVGAKMNLAVLSMTAEGENRELAERVGGLINEAIDESRSLSAELSPPILRSAGLGPALGWLGGQFRTRHDLDVRVACDADASLALPESIAALLFGAARECLLNAAKHADADVVRVRFGPAGPESERGAGVTLTVADDGRGYDAAAGDGGFGMSDLRQRVDLLGGAVEVVSAPGEGCAVRIDVPLPGGDP